MYRLHRDYNVHRIVFLVLIFHTLPLVKGKHRYNANTVASLEDDGLTTKNPENQNVTHISIQQFLLNDDRLILSSLRTTTVK